MSTHGSLIQDLEQAIARGTDAARAAALRQVTDLFVSCADRLTDDQVVLFDDVMERLIEHIETLALIELSERLAPLDNAPLQTVRRLAYDDDIDVARPVLTRSRRLAESDLIALAKTKGQSHLLAISERSELNEALAAVLVVRGDTMVRAERCREPGREPLREQHGRACRSGRRRPGARRKAGHPIGHTAAYLFSA